MCKNTNNYRLVIESHVIRLECAKRGWGQRELAQHAGMSHQYLRYLTIGGYRHAPGRLRIESALDKPIFSSEQDFNNRKLLATRFGFDLYLAPVARLRQLAKEFGLPGHWSRSTRIPIIAAFVNWLKTHQTA